MRDILPTLARWHADGRRAAIATVVERRGSAPRDAGASLALNDVGEIAGSVTGGCVEPSVIREAQEVLDGGPPRLREYGIADDEAFEVGLACGGTVAILIARLEAAVIPTLAEAVRVDRPVALAVTVAGDRIGEQRLVDPA
jgi:xanthine dehydrogenase accessory factor